MTPRFVGIQWFLVLGGGGGGGGVLQFPNFC